MPAKPKLPRKPRTRLPKGTRRNDYTEEALVDFDRNRWRIYKETSRKRQRHAGTRDVTFAFGHEARTILAKLCKERGLTKTQLLTQLLKEQTHGT